MRTQETMTNTLALWLGALLLGAVAIDAILLDWSLLTFAMRGFVDLIRWVAFWR